MRDHRPTAVHGVTVFLAHAIGIAIFAAIVGTFLITVLGRVHAALAHFP